MVENRLLYDHGRYRIDFADLEEKLSRDDVKLMILCNPINPMGTVIPPEDQNARGSRRERLRRRVRQ